MAAMLAACGGFLLGVLWMDLLFDVQVVGPDPSGGVASIAAYYRRVTTEAYPMNRLIGAIMVVTLGGVIYGLARQRISRRFGVPALALATVPIGLALLRVVPNAVRLGSGADPPAAQLDLARGIYLDHVVCLLLMSGFVALIAVASRRSSWSR